jgi:hypothetical protein
MSSVKPNLTVSLGTAMGSSIVCIGIYCLPHQYPLILCPCRQQISLFVFPYVHAGPHGVALTPFRSFIVILGWIMGKPLTLLFDPFESIVLFLSGETFTCYRCNPTPMSADSVFWLVLTVNHLVRGGKSNWLKGMILICTHKLLYVPASFSLFHDR